MQPPEVFCKKGVLRNFAKFAGKHLCQRLCIVAGLSIFGTPMGGPKILPKRGDNPAKGELI